MVELHKKPTNFVLRMNACSCSFLIQILYIEYDVFIQQKVYKEDFEKEIKGRSSLDLDKTPAFLHVKHITNLMREVWPWEFILDVTVVPCGFILDIT
jgi:hypothetical protein